MLIIFGGVPVAAPGKAVCGKKPVAKVVLINLIRKTPGAVGIDLTAFGGDISFALCGPVEDHIGIVKRVDVNGTAKRMFGEAVGAVHHPVVETGGVVIFHGQGVVPAVFVDEADSFDPVVIQIKLIEDLHHVLSDGLIADQLSGLRLSVKINIQKSHIVQILIGDGTSALRI